MSREGVETAHTVHENSRVSRPAVLAALIAMTHRLVSRACFVVLFALSGCYGHSRVIQGAEGDGGISASPACARGGDCTEIAVSNVDKVDLLFVIDNSESMAEEQATLQREFPKIIQTLTMGVGSPADEPFPPAEDLHLGIVSGDMGLVGVTGIPGCENLGDDGILNHVPNRSMVSQVSGCQATYPRFLTHLDNVNDPATTANDVACLANLGTHGCVIQQPLEAALKALWPSIDVCRDPSGCPTSGTTYGLGEVIEPNRLLFLGDAMGFGIMGHGDLENNQFLRDDPTLGRSLVAVVVVTNDEDCSSLDTSHLTPGIFLDPDDPLASQPTELRCFHNPENLYAVERYVTGLRALRPDDESLVVFAAIVGVPPDLVDRDARRDVDFGDAESRDAYYDRIFEDDRMRQRPDTSLPPEEGHIVSSCSSANGDAYPPSRIVDVARRFGENGIVQSICSDDFGPAFDAIIDTIGTRLGARCLDHALSRDDEGLVGCDLLWELPPPGTAPAGTPTSCEDRPYLAAPVRRVPPTSESGGQVCLVQQLAVRNESATTTDGIGDGWYYDDFTLDVTQECESSTPQRIAFTPAAKPETGIRVVLDCDKSASD